jgi:hypothetical protein
MNFKSAIIACLVLFSFSMAVTVSDLLKNPSIYLNDTVTVTGKIVANKNYRMCTLIACSMQNPCCNACMASPYLVAGADSLPLFSSNDSIMNKLQCRANECITPVCSLFIDTAATYAVRGIFKYGNFQYARDSIYQLDYLSTLSTKTIKPMLRFQAVQSRLNAVSTIFDICGRRCKTASSTSGIFVSGGKIRLRMP